MQHTLTFPPAGSAEVDVTPPTLNVVIVYEDFETGTHAKKTYDFLVENVRPECQFTNQMWKFDVLSIPKLREIAVRDAATADIVIISSHGGELPAHVKSWVESWLEKPGTTLALVGLFDHQSPETWVTREYLAQAARRGKMAFFAQPDDWPDRRLTPAPVAFQHNDGWSGRTLSTLAGAMQRENSAPHWGINE
jgi:hypothetical protein